MQKVVDFFTYTFPVFSNVGVGATVTANLVIDASADFEVLQLQQFTNIANAAFVMNTRPIPNAAIMLTDSGSGRNLMNTPTPLASIAGTGEFPYNLPQPRLLARSSTLICALTNFDAAVATYQIYISLVGRKIFTMGPVPA